MIIERHSTFVPSYGGAWYRHFIFFPRPTRITSMIFKIDTSSIRTITEPIGLIAVYLNDQQIFSFTGYSAMESGQAFITQMLPGNMLIVNLDLVITNEDSLYVDFIETGPHGDYITMSAIVLGELYTGTMDYERSFSDVLAFQDTITTTILKSTYYERSFSDSLSFQDSMQSILSQFTVYSIHLDPRFDTHINLIPMFEQAPWNSTSKIGNKSYIMMTNQYEVGDSILIEVNVTKREPFSEVVPYDPEHSVVNVKNGDGQIVWTSELIRKDIGQWYTIWNTTGMQPGDYVVEIIAWDGQLSSPISKEVSINVVRLV